MLQVFALSTSNPAGDRNAGWPCYEGGDGVSLVQPDYAASPITGPTCNALYTPAQGFSTTVVAQYVGHQFLDEQNIAPVGGYTTLAANLGYHFGRYRVLLEGNNLTNQRQPVSASEFGSESFYLLNARTLWLRVTCCWR